MSPRVGDGLTYCMSTAAGRTVYRRLCFRVMLIKLENCRKVAAVVGKKFCYEYCLAVAHSCESCWPSPGQTVQPAATAV